MTVSEIFSIDCRGTVFDLPCPTSFVGGEVYAPLDGVFSMRATEVNPFRPANNVVLSFQALRPRNHGCRF